MSTPVNFLADHLDNRHQLNEFGCTLADQIQRQWPQGTRSIRDTADAVQYFSALASHAALVKMVRDLEQKKREATSQGTPDAS
jgi:hypothetical protein